MRDKDSLTLIELLVVIIILGILVAISLPNFSRYLERSYDKEASTTLNLILAAERIYFLNSGKYYPESGSVTDITAINENLSLYLKNSTSWDYTLNGFEVNSNPCWNATAVRTTSGSRTWEIGCTVDEPICVSSSCL